MITQINRIVDLSHTHIEYAEYKAVVDISNGNLLAGDFPPNKLRLVLAWIEIHREELMANWQLAIEGRNLFKIEPLK